VLKKKIPFVDFYYFFHKIATRWQSRHTLWMGFFFITWPYFLIWKEKCEMQQRIVVLFCEYIYMKSYTNIWTQDATCLYHSMDCTDSMDCLVNLLHETPEVFQGCYVSEYFSSKNVHSFYDIWRGCLFLNRRKIKGSRKW
jgi:hypothetical protein